MPNYKLELSYDGTRYNGWQRLGDTDNTIQHRVEETLSRICGEDTEVFSSGRTDAGVHARRQVCSFKTESELECESVLKDLRHYLPEDIGALSLKKASDRFHARYNAIGKTYLYRIRVSSEPDIFNRRYVYNYTEELNIPEMKRAAGMLLGEHDFSAFTSEKHIKKSPVKELRSVDIKEINGEVRIYYNGDSFLRNMVRILTGTLLEVGTGRLSADSIPDILKSGKRENAGFMAPAKGLILWDVEY